MSYSNFIFYASEVAFWLKINNNFNFLRIKKNNKYVNVNIFIVAQSNLVDKYPIFLYVFILQNL